MNFNNATKISRTGRYCIGIEEESGKYWISFPVRNWIVEDEEYYEITAAEFELFSEDLDKAKDLVERCRQRLEDQRLLRQPFQPRGYPC
ncbi:MAG: hypothetical protein RL011_1404 [Pseudomonadota bacterium]|jgi:hypothetical protein